MIEIRTNTQVVIGGIVDQLGILMNPQELMKLAAAAVLPVLKKRVHEDGEDSNGQKIGVYSPGYMKVRTGIFANSGNYVRGPKKGTPKNTGVFTRGPHKGSPRPKYNRTNDTKVVGSLTRQMENDMVIIPTDNGYGIGYQNQHNMDKALWLDATYKKKILTKLTESEEDIGRDAVDKQVNDIVQKINGI